MTERLLPTPSHTIGPFYGHALPFPDGGRVAPQGRPDAITLHGHVYDGEGRTVPDALLDFWQAAPDGSVTGAPGSMRRDPSTGGFAGRDGVGFTGFGRVPTDADGHYALHTLMPGNAGLPYISVCVFARGLTHHLFTRAYLADGTDPLLDALPAGRRGTLLAAGGPHRTYRFDIRLQGEGETVFLEFT
ncbi:protocatechuate 3,4-dioxygenase subunit alpha [Streptomyces fructofermentans]|uniref:Protocatechuate 3,4-dioxygenase subunit alpha n=1 Tax=Streptomyces fructofermentans TaxID=152141 RepID=A0A918N7K6_9ACTN|nr:protocatechuate 3,4-dioxygenase subunit alpha [Streptomyces fructofermentans]GGX44413.1 protocatechuate 3,4-dioxygenase subunit alpha [Streptomyces fructofermentans]